MITDWKKEVAEAVALNRARQEASWRKENPGKLRLYMLRADNDPEVFSPQYQADFKWVVTALEQSGIEVDAPWMTMDAVDAPGGYIGEIAIFAKAYGPYVSAILVAWLRLRVGHKVLLKDGDIEISARTVEEVETLYNRVTEERRKPPADF